MNLTSLSHEGVRVDSEFLTLTKIYLVIFVLEWDGGSSFHSVQSRNIQISKSPFQLNWLLWYRPLEYHVFGKYSLAVVQGNRINEKSWQVTINENSKSWQVETGLWALIFLDKNGVYLNASCREGSTKYQDNKISIATAKTRMEYHTKHTARRF